MPAATIVAIREVEAAIRFFDAGCFACLTILFSLGYLRNNKRRRGSLKSVDVNLANN